MKLFSSAEIDEILNLPILQQFEQQKEIHYAYNIGPDYRFVLPGLKSENWTIKAVAWDTDSYAVYGTLEVVYDYNRDVYITRNYGTNYTKDG